MATPSTILAWKVPRAEEPGGLRPWGHKESDRTEQLTQFQFQGWAFHCYIHARGWSKAVLSR